MAQHSLIDFLQEEPPAHIANRKAPALGKLKIDSDSDDEEAAAAVRAAREKAIAKDSKDAKDSRDSPKSARVAAEEKAVLEEMKKSQSPPSSGRRQSSGSTSKTVSKPSDPSEDKDEKNKRRGSAWTRALIGRSSTVQALPSPPAPATTAERLLAIQQQQTKGEAGTSSTEGNPPPQSVPEPKELPTPPSRDTRGVFFEDLREVSAPIPALPTPPDTKPSFEKKDSRRYTMGGMFSVSSNEKLPKFQEKLTLHFADKKSENFVSFGTFTSPLTFESLLSNMCSSKSSMTQQQSLREEFFLVYPHFLRPEQLLDSICELFAWEGSDKAGIFDFINVWILNYFDDFRSEKSLIEKLTTWLAEVKKRKPFMNPVETTSRNLAQMLHQGPPAELLTDLRETEWQKLSADQIAIQLTLISHDYLKRIPIRQFIDHPWISKPDLSIQIRACIERFNLVSGWTATQIVSNTQAKKRAKILKTLISVAVKLRKLRNYDAMMAVVQGLDRSASTRLKQTWENVPKKDLAIMIELTDLCSPAGNYNALKQEQNNAPLPCVPYLGVHLSELVYIDEEESQTPQFELNWVKMKKLADKLQQLQKYQTAEYSRKVLNSMVSNSILDIGALESLFQRNDLSVAHCMLELSPVYDDETLYRLSAFVEPKNSISAVGPTPKELLSPQRRQLLENVANQSEDSMILQKRSEQKRINKLRQAVTDLLDSLPHSTLYELELVAGLNTVLNIDDANTVDEVVDALSPSIVPRDALLSVSVTSEGFRVSVSDRGHFLNLALLSVLKVGEAEYTMSLVSPMLVRVRLTDLPFHVVSDTTVLEGLLSLLGSIEAYKVETLSGKYTLPTGSAFVVFKSVHSLFARQTVIPGTAGIHVLFLDDSTKWEKCIDDAGFVFLAGQKAETTAGSEQSDEGVSETVSETTTESDVKLENSKDEASK